VETAPMMKRFRAASMGRGARIRKRLSHLTIYLTES
jgi:ribosomal protein L22